MPKRVLIVEFSPAVPTLGTHLCSPTYGVPLLATILAKKGFETRAFVEGISFFGFRDLLKADIICFSVMTSAANKTYAVADKLLTHGKTVVFGGTHPTYFPESCLPHCNYVVRGEGDEVLPQLLEAICRGQGVGGIAGVSYLSDGRLVHNPRPPVPTVLNHVCDHSVIAGLKSWPSVRRLGRYTLLPVQTSRGCRKACSFCVAKTMFGGVYRKRPVEVVLDELRSAARFSRRVLFVDNDFIGTTKQDRDHTWRLCKRIASEVRGLNATAFVTVGASKYPALLREMYSAGVRNLCLGLESLDESSLSRYGKCQDSEGMSHSVHALKELGFRVSGSFMAGGNGEDAETIRQTVEVAIRWGLDSMYLFVLSPYPTMTELVPKERIILDNWDMASGQFVYFLPLNVPPSTLQQAIIDGVKRFYGWRRILTEFASLRWANAFLLATERLAFSPIARAMRRHVANLRHVEGDLYETGELNIELLPQKGLKRLSEWDSAGTFRPE